MWNLPGSGIKPTSPALTEQIYHWATREASVLQVSTLLHGQRHVPVVCHCVSTTNMAEPRCSINIYWRKGEREEGRKGTREPSLHMYGLCCCVNGALWSCAHTEAMSLEEEGRGAKRPIRLLLLLLVTQLCWTLLQPHRRKPIRLFCPWDSPGKNTGVGSHFWKKPHTKSHMLYDSRIWNS